MQLIKQGKDTSGKLTEKLFKSIARRNNMQVIDGKYGSNNGIDHILQTRDGIVTIVVENKQVSSRGSFLLREGIDGHIQLEDAWIKAVIDKLEYEKPEAYRILRKSMKNHTLKKAVAGVDRTSGKFIIVPVKQLPK